MNCTKIKKKDGKLSQWQLYHFLSYAFICMCWCCLMAS